MKVDSEGSIRCKCDLLAVSESEPGCGFGRWLDDAHDQWPKDVDDLNERSVKSVARVDTKSINYGLR
ncbi:hypothetical protein TIFTF001_021076 [Ficus carica]|uniref:Uncharacterized protein n=1 Tax=Ficus carica TaxID=3494 RepID=A0AA88DDA8_FICCA|nr:hypothetical protein TIFTF001_021076 [Ficus carica]